jgi:AraC family transcriptional regulator
MTPRIEQLTGKKLIGQRMRMSLADNKTADLWRGFMPRRKDIKSNLNSDLLSMQVYDNPLYFNEFDPNNTFEKWAAVEVLSYDNVPLDMETFDLIAGEYAVFNYKGLSTDTRIFQFIYGVWLPNSAYVLDDRPHFEILGAQYKNNSPDSEEEIWIPIKVKN